MQASPFLMPPPVASLLSHLPAYPGSLLFVTGLNLALAKSLAPDVTQMLVGKKLRLRVTDTQWTFDFEWANGRFVACTNKDADETAVALCSEARAD